VSASIGTTVFLANSEVTVSSCQNFVTCTPGVGSSEIIGVNFKFGLGTSTVGVSSTQYFDTSVTTRN